MSNVKTLEKFPPSYFAAFFPIMLTWVTGSSVFIVCFTFQSLNLSRIHVWYNVL